MSKPLVSVWCSTYNHQNYIAQAIEGFVMQKTNFEIEIFVHDDASTDTTAAIIRRYVAEYPQIKPIYQTENKFSVDKSYLNRIMFEKVRGKYLALCEGDDYWTDPLKLQKQVDFLEANPDFAICFHPVKIVHEDNSREPEISNKNEKEVLEFEDLASKNHIHTPSCVFRNGLFNELPEWFYESPVGDWILHLLNAQHGKVKFLEDVMAVYRVHQGGVWSMQKQVDIHTKWVSVVEHCRKYFFPRGKDEFGQQIAGYYSEILFTFFNTSRYADYRHHFFACIKYVKYLKKRTFVALTTRWLLSYFPHLAILFTNRQK